MVSPSWSGGRARRRAIVLALWPDSEPWFLIEHAADWAKVLGARLDLCTVIPRHAANGAERRAVGRWLSGLTEDVLPPLRGKTAVLEGLPGPALVEHARRYGLILVGRRGTTGLSGRFRPALHRQLALDSPAPVMIVRGRRPRPDMVALLPAVASPLGPDVAAWVAQNLPTARVVGVRTDGASELAFPCTVDRRVQAGSGRRAALRRGNVLTPFEAGSIFASHARHIDAGLVAVAAHRRTGAMERLFGSAFDGLMRDCPCTLLVMPRAHPNALRQPRAALRRPGWRRWGRVLIGGGDASAPDRWIQPSREQARS